jgi:hypothetical protein
MLLWLLCVLHHQPWRLQSAAVTRLPPVMIPRREAAPSLLPEQQLAMLRLRLRLRLRLAPARRQQQLLVLWVLMPRLRRAACVSTPAASSSAGLRA